MRAGDVPDSGRSLAASLTRAVEDAMKKLALDLGALKVESFDTFVPEAQRGTVRANSGCVTYSCPPGTCGANPDTTFEKGLWLRTQTACPQCCV
jgi:hypothetical protein